MHYPPSEQPSTAHRIPLGGRIPPPPILSWYGVWLLVLMLPMLIMLVLQLRGGSGAVPMRTILSNGMMFLMGTTILRLFHASEQWRQLCRVREARIRQLEQPPLEDATTLHGVLAHQLIPPMEHHGLRQAAAESRARRLSGRASLVLAIPVILSVLALIRGVPDAALNWPASLRIALTTSFVGLAAMFWRQSSKEWALAAESSAAIDRMKMALVVARVTDVSGGKAAARVVKEVLRDLGPPSAHAACSGGAGHAPAGSACRAQPGC